MKSWLNTKSINQIIKLQRVHTLFYPLFDITFIVLIIKQNKNEIKYTNAKEDKVKKEMGKKMKKKRKTTERGKKGNKTNNLQKLFVSSKCVCTFFMYIHNYNCSSTIDVINDIKCKYNNNQFDSI